MLDFVPNHTAPDHPWVQEHPDYYVRGNDGDLAREPQNYIRLRSPGSSMVFAYGRDPYFPGWPDALQLNYGNPDVQKAMKAELEKISGLCDGVRCDMAMLILPDVFQRTWGIKSEPFWTGAINQVRQKHPGFAFMAEVYWDLEWTLQQQGFDYTYDKRLYDRLRDQHARSVRDHFRAEMDYQRHSARFLENHDEPRAAATFPKDVHQAAAVLTFMCPGLRFFHQGQWEGNNVKISMHLCRGPEEKPDKYIEDFYTRLLRCVSQPATQNGEWQLLDCVPAWDGNNTWDNFVAFAWRISDYQPLVVVVNYSPTQSQGYLRLPFEKLAGKTIRLNDLMNPVEYERVGDDLVSSGLYLDEGPWSYHIFDLTTLNNKRKR
jgi:hypothetical protein